MILRNYYLFLIKSLMFALRYKLTLILSREFMHSFYDPEHAPSSHIMKHKYFIFLIYLFQLCLFFLICLAGQITDYRTLKLNLGHIYHGVFGYFAHSLFCICVPPKTESESDIREAFIEFVTPFWEEKDISLHEQVRSQEICWFLA